MNALSHLEERLPLAATPAPRVSDSRAGSGPPSGLPRHLERMLAEPIGPDRSGQTHGVVAAALEWGLDDGQVHDLLASHAPTVEKYGNRLEREVDRELLKLRPDHQHPGQPCDRAGCPSRPRWMSGALPVSVSSTGVVPETSAKAEQPTPDVDAFWQEREVLAHLLAFARARMVSPWALLGVSVVRVLAVVPPHVVLPPLIGSYGSLNTFVASVGPSGGGKGASEGAAADALDVGLVETHTAGSGEGLAHLYARREKKEVVRHRDSVLLTVPEVDTLVALKSRQGSTMLPTLRSAWSGERLGFSYADPDKALPIEKHTYRLGLVLGVQPGRAAPLLDDADGGTPQRFLWLPTTDPGAPEELPPLPPQRHVARHHWSSERLQSQGFHVLTVPDVARVAVQKAGRARLLGQEAILDGHALFARLKLAQALALLDDRAVMTDEDWRLSGVVMRVSDHTRGAVQRFLSSQARESNLSRARFDGERSAVAEDVAAEHATQRCCRFVVRHLTGKGDVARSDVRRALASRDRRYFNEAVNLLVAAGQLVLVAAEQGERLRLAEVVK